MESGRINHEIRIPKKESHCLAIRNCEGDLICDVYFRDKAALIVRAVNNHDELVAALEDAQRRIKESQEWWIDVPERGGFDLKTINSVLEKVKS